MTRRTLVLMGFAEALAAPETAWSLVDAGYRVVAFARRNRRAAIRFSRHVEVVDVEPPEKDVAATLRDLGALLDAQRVANGEQGVLLPLDDASLWLCSRAQMPPGWTLAGAAGPCAELALDKQRQVAVAASAGFSVPPTAFAATVADLEREVREFPVILRSAHAVDVSDGRIRKGRNWVCADDGELQRAASAWNGRGLLLVQPFLAGTGEGIFGMATEGGVVAWSAHRRLRMMNPHGSGSSACTSRDVAEDARQIAQRFVATCDWRGMFMIEMLRTDSGALYFVEFNGRAWGSMALSRRQALEYPAWTVAQALDPAFAPQPPARPTAVTSRHLGRELMHLLFVLRGPQSRAFRTWPSFWRTLLSLVRPHANSSFYNWRRQDWRVFAGDCWYTVREQVRKPR
jgi:hypothetical protein